jgi:hypothetical protein
MIHKRSVKFLISMQSDKRKSISIDQRNLNNEHAKLQNRDIKIMTSWTEKKEKNKKGEREIEQTTERASMERGNLWGLYSGQGPIWRLR